MLLQREAGLGEVLCWGAEMGRMSGKSLKDQGQAKQKQGQIQIEVVCFCFVHGEHSFVWEDHLFGVIDVPTVAISMPKQGRMYL